MIVEISSLAENTNPEIPALIEILLAAEQRLEELTAGELGTVVGRDGRAFRLRKAQEQLQHSEADKQASILNSLPAHVALLDSQGIIISVNEAWRQFALANALLAPGHGIGVNYLAICDRAQGHQSLEGPQVAAGIRAVLSGEEKSFSLEYACHSPTAQRWFLLTVTPLGEDHSNGAVVMHLNVTERKENQEALKASQKRLRDLIDGLGPSIFVGLMTLQGVLIECNRSSLVATGLKPEDVLGIPFEETHLFSHSQEVQRQVRAAIEQAGIGQPSRYDMQIRGAGNDFIDVDFSIQPLRDEAGEVVFLIPSASVITESLRAKTSLREIELRLAHAMSLAQLVAWEFDPTKGLFTFSDSYYVLHGTTAALEGGNEMSAEDFARKFVHSDDARVVAEELGKAVATTDPDYRAQLECRIIRRDGDLRHVLVSISITKDVTGRTIQVHGANQDITERKRGELASLRLLSIIEFSDDGIIGKDLNGIVTSWNRGAEKIFGYTADDMVGTSIMRLIPADRQAEETEILTKIRRGESVEHFETRRQGKNGRLIDVSVTVSPMKDTSGNVFGVSKVVRDISKLKRAEETLRESDEKFRQLAENISDVFWITSPDLNRMYYVSAGYELIWGRSAESLYAHPHQWIETILPEEREDISAAFTTLMESAPKVSVEYRIARPDGTVRWIHDRGFQVRNSTGTLVRLIGIASDITERKLEAQLRQAQKMEAIGTLAGGIAHDFNNILAAIIGYSEMAQRSISQESRAQSHLEHVLIASGRAKGLVRQILAFSRQEDPELEAIQLQPIIDETLKLLQISLPPTVQIRQNIDITAPSVLGDPTQMHQVIMNLCVNAGQSMKERGGVIEVWLTYVDIDQDFASAYPELKQGPYIQLRVSDTGCGMDPAIQERIFEPFFTTKAPGEGTGLGLAVVHGVIRNHGGAIVISSELGVGTSISIYLPVHGHLQSPFVQESDPVQRGNGERILFVDDEETLVSLGKTMLEDLGYRVTTKTDSVEALRAFRLQPEGFDLVITDQTMPRLTGADLATALLALRPALPVILVTGYSSTINPAKAKAMGIQELLFKPNTVRTLGKAIQRALAK